MTWAGPIARVMGGVSEGEPWALQGLEPHCNLITSASHLPGFILALLLFLLRVEHTSTGRTQQRAVCGFLFGLAEGRFCLPSTTLPAEPRGVNSHLQVSGTTGLLAKVTANKDLPGRSRGALFS